MISIKLLCFILRQECSPVNLLYIFRAPFSKNTSRGLLLHQDTEIQNQPEIITSAEKFFTKAANIVEIIPANQNESTDEDESKQNNTIDRMSVKVSYTIKAGIN